MGRKSEINKKDLLNLYEISDEEFARITDNLYSQKIDYKSLPNLVLLPNVKEELRNELNIKGNLYITKNRLLHTNPIRKNAHKKQGFTKDEYKAIPDTIRKATYALKETDSEYNSFLITALDKNDSTKANCIIFDEDTNGNLLTTIKKVPLLSLRNRTYEIVGTGVEPAISNALREPSTTLTTSPNDQNLTTKEDFVKTQAYANIEERNVALERTSDMENITADEAARIYLAQELKVNIPELTESERAAAIAIMEAGAASMQTSISDYIQNTFPDGIFGDFSKTQDAAHQQGVEINGAVSVRGFGDSVKATIYAGKTADFSTWVHELSHVWQAQLSGKLKNDAEKAFQVKDGNWQKSIYTFEDGHTDTSAEAFAYGFEDFLKKKAGEMAAEDKKAIFEKFADYMARTYNGTKEHIKINENISKVYEQFVRLDDNILAQAEKAVQQEKEFNKNLSENERQRIAVRERYKDTDLWLKAPNGKISNLTEEQWVTVHTPNFKRWFGNWDYDENKKIEPVELNLASVEFNHNNAREVEKWMKENLSGKSVEVSSSGAKVLFFNKGLQDSLKRHGEIQRDSYSVMESLVENAELFDFVANDGKDKHKGILGQDIYYSALKVDDKYYSVQFKFNVSGKYFTDSYKDHKIAEIKIAPLPYRGSNNAHADTSAIHSFTISELTGGVKPEFSKVIDANGEPLVVYHGSPNSSFDVFDRNKIGTTTDYGLYGKGFYFSNQKPQAEMYGETTEVFLNIRKPLSIDDFNSPEQLANELDAYPEYFVMQNGRVKPSGSFTGFDLYLEAKNYDGVLVKQTESLNEIVSFKPNQIKSAANNNGNFDINNDSILFQLVGERSIMRMTQNEERKRILEDLAAAKLMDEKYSNIEPSLKATRIRFATGWEKSADGQWKYELDDSLNRIKSGSLFEKILNTSPEMLEQLTKNTTLTLDDIMEAPELYGVFPFMKNVRVGFYSDPNAFRAVLTPDGIKINTKYLDGISGEKGMKGVLAHEIQHIIQAVEYSGSKGINGESIEQLYNNMMEAMKAASKRYDYDVSSLEHGLSEYMHDSGEIEARNVARRIFMNASERRHTTLESTEDIARNMQFQIIGEQGAGKLDRNTESNERIANLDTAKENEKSLTKEAGKDYEALKQYQQKYPVSTLDVSSDVKEQLNIVFEQINSYFDNGISPKDGRFILPEVPEYMANTGSDKTPISLPVAVIKKARDVHQLNNDEIKNSILKLYDPIAVFESDKEKSENKANSKLILTDEFTNQSKPIVLAININSNIKISNGKKALEVQDIRSIHDRTLIANNGTDLIQKWTQDGLCRYVDEKKITEWSNVARVYFPIDELNSAENKILTKSELVNSHTEVEQRNVALETSEERNMTELKTYHTLKEEDVKNLEIISDEDFSNIVDSIILNDYKNIPNTIRLPNINSELAEKLGLEKDSAFIMKKSATHIRPDRKGSYNQALDTEEYRMIPKVMRDATFALVDKRVKNFQILFDDKNDIKKINKIVFNKDELGNYLVTIGKVGRQNSISEKENIVVGVGVAPTISDLRFPKGQPATRLRPSPTTVNSNIAQNKEMSTEKQTLPPYVKTLNSLIDQAVKEEKISAGKTQDDETKQKKQIPPNLTKKAASDFLRAVQEGTAPFFSMQNDDFGKITMTPQLIVNAQTGLPFKDETQLLAQIYSAEQDMNGQIVTSMEGAKEAGTYIKKCDEAMKNFVLVNQQHLSGENKVMPTRYFSPEAAENPDMVYANVLHKNRPAKIKSFRKLCLHFERLPEGQKDIQVILTKIAWEHLKELQRELKLPDGWKTENLTEKDIIEKKEYIKNYFEKVPARERTVFQETFGICTDIKKEYGDPAFSDKTRKIMDDKLTQFIKDNSFSAEYLAAFTKEEYDKLEDWKKEKGRQNKIEAVGIKEPEVYLGRYLAACNSHAEFITDAETIKVIKEKLSTKLKQNYKLEKYDILKEIGMQAGNICKETMKQNVFSKAHSHDKKQELSVQKDKQHPPVGMGASK